MKSILKKGDEVNIKSCDNFLGGKGKILSIDARFIRPYEVEVYGRKNMSVNLHDDTLLTKIK